MDRRRLGRIKLIFTEVVDRFLYQLTYNIIQQLGQWWLVRGICIPFTFCSTLHQCVSRGNESKLL